LIRKNKESIIDSRRLIGGKECGDVKGLLRTTNALLWNADSWQQSKMKTFSI
jgi:hypothetical protein